LAEPLKNQFGAEIPRRIAAMIASVRADFDGGAFVADALAGYDALDLMARGRRIAAALRRHLPGDYRTAAETLIASLGPKLERTEGLGMAPFLYLPHVLFVAEYGLDDFETSLRAQYELTQRFTAEFSIRRFLERHPEATLARLELWTRDPSVHVRRLVSEGTRPRLPWTPRLRAFQDDPRPVLALLELLKDDPEIYVRRSVANNLNDIGKDHPDLLARTARRWMRDATEKRRWLIRRALRSALKRGEAGALEILGFGAAAKLSIRRVRIAPKRARIGGSVSIRFALENASRRRQRVLVDLRVHFVKARSKTGPKVFKLKTVDLAPRAVVRLEKTLSLAPMTTRRHYPGVHRVDVLLNGRVHPLGAFDVVEAGAARAKPRRRK
jgi:3-methyladenine DNA glycosylase AlkC